MPNCRECHNEADLLVTVTLGGRKRKMCEDCADRRREAGEIAVESEQVVREMMGFRGTRT